MTTFEYSSTFHDTQKAINRRLVKNWLYCVCLLIFVMVIVGGATRLTDSGLSITEWKPLLGAIPPLNAADWQIAFDKYRQIPEYTLINKGMSLSEFQFIYWWEWGHRFLGRLIGLFVALPLAFFWVTGRLEPYMKPRLVLLFILGGMQGVIGWWMVKSGLVERVDVSQYRLAIHLTLACVIFAYAMWLARGLAIHSEEHATSAVTSFAPIIVFAIVLQIFLGALVAGLDAGLAFNDWPLMDGAVIPTDLWVQSPAIINAFENPKTVQFIHRMSAYAVLLLIVMQMIAAYASTSGNTHKRRTLVLVGLGIAQAAIGIITLVMQVPMSWALMHQGGAVVLLGFAIAHWRGIKGSYA
jgi:cytochrome c oxidase assembly protein subunit 15